MAWHGRRADTPRDWHPTLQANKAQLSAAVASQVEATKSGLDMLTRAHQALVLMRQHFQDITRLCAECQSLIDCHDKIAVLSEVHYNLRKTLQVSACCDATTRHCGTLLIKARGTE
jgi:hypothetical protein